MNIYNSFKPRFVPEKPFLLSSKLDVTYSYMDIDQKSGSIASYLTNLGLKEGDRLMAQMEKTPETILLYLACLRSGIVYIPLNTSYLTEEIKFFVNDAEPSLIVTDREREKTFELLIEKKKVLTIESLIESTSKPENQEKSFLTKEMSDSSIAVMLYTSGTTGNPKGAMISHGNLLSNVISLTKIWKWEKNDVLLHSLPIYHVHGLFVGLHMPLFNSSAIIYLDKFSASQVVSLLPKATVFMGVPTYYVRMLREESLNSAICNNMRCFISGSAPLLEKTFNEFKKRTGFEIVERYGMTETGMNTSNPLSGEKKIGTVGLPLEGTQVRIRNKEGHIAKDNETGELEIKGRNVFGGYWRKERQTDEDFTADGFFMTGDLAKVDEDKYVTIIGRKKDLIISGGLNVYPKEVESVIDSLPGVKESAVIGLPHFEFGEKVCGIVITEKGKQLSEAEILRKLKSILANFKIPKEIYFMKELPRNSMGKVKKKFLREKFG
ncbi:MAG: malonyl-CoA synthase [Gammaproteobacteria bacterium]|nr:malonyl-CoA synthase [Gammaproteobacteria bacterium]